MIMVNNIQQDKRLVRQSKSMSGCCACKSFKTHRNNDMGYKAYGGGGNWSILELDHTHLRAI